MANTLIIGDIAEGSKWFGQVEFLKQQLLMTYKTSNRSMHTWKALSSDVSAFVELRNGEPYAFIYVGGQGDYEFFTPESVGDYVAALGRVAFNGTKFYKDKPEVMSDDGSFPELVLRNEYPSFPVNTWYSEDCWVTGGLGVRYAQLTPLYTADHLQDYPASVYEKVEGGAATSVFTSPELVNAASRKGNYCFAISSTGVAYAWDITTGELLGSLDIVLDVPADIPEQLTAKGSWAFNRAGDKACTHVLIQQYQRFGNPTTFTRGNLFTTYVVEVGFTTDLSGGFSGIELSQIIETGSPVVAADYNWTVESNALIVAEITTFDYALSIALPFVPYTRYEVGDVIKTTATAGGVVRLLDLYLVTELTIQVLSDGTLGGYGVSGASIEPSNSLNNTGGVKWARLVPTDRVADCWLNIREPSGDVLKRVELQHNITETSLGNWHFTGHPQLDLRASSYGFIYRLSGLDLRVLGATLWSGLNFAAGAWATIYDIERGTPLSSSAGQVEYPSNSYDTFTAIHKCWFSNPGQTIAAIPYLRSSTDNQGKEILYPIKECAVYAYNEVARTSSTVTSGPETIDFMIDKNGTEKTSYHATTYEKAGTGVAPYKYFRSGGWAKKKDRL